MRPSATTPSDEPLPFAKPNVPALRVPAGLSLRGEAVAQFDALLHELNPDAVRVDPERVQNLCVWLASLPPQAAHDVLDRRLRRMEQLRMMLDDADWDADDAIRVRLRKLFAYIDQDDISELTSLGAVGEIAGQFYGPDGADITSSLSARTVSVPL